MQWFRSRKIFGDKASVSQQLKLTREKKNLRLEEVAAATNVNLRYLAALETGDYGLLPAGIYGLNYLREYANFLDLDYDKLLNKFKEEQRIYQSSEQHHLFARQTVRRKYFMAVPNVLKYASIAVVAVLSLAYLWFLIQNIFLPPRLEIISPAASETIVGKPTVVVAGKTDKETEILINDRQAMVSATGEFSEEVNLHPGVNTITIVAQKAAKKENIVTREVLYRETAITP
jgi:cytoskeletal protein RodZ